MKKEYIFTSERLGFRSWMDSDLNELAELNASPEVMEHFPKPLSRQESKEMLQRLQNHFEERGHCYFATEILETGELIGFIGLAYQTYDTDFNPSVDIGWRIKKSSWGFGYATEGAKRCLEYAFTTLKLDRVIATCTTDNKPSESVMQKIGMKRKKTFIHPLLKEYKALEKCLLYEIVNDET